MQRYLSYNLYTHSKHQLLKTSHGQVVSWGGKLEAVYNNLYTALILIHLITYFYTLIILIQLN